MNSNPYYFEIQDLINQFIHAFDNIVINRETNSGEVKDQIDVRYVYAPKQRTLHNLVNKAEHITLPCVSIWITSINRDPNRVFNKWEGHHYMKNSGELRNIPQPIPINIGIGMSIITRYQSDMNRILSNFVPYNDPYIVISWQRRELGGIEIRTEVAWGEGLSIQYPIDINNNQPAKIVADTTFTIKAWLFKKDPETPIGNIYKIDADFSPHREITIFNDMEEQKVEMENFNGYDSLRIHGRPKFVSIQPSSLSIDNSNKEIFVRGNFLGGSDMYSVYLSGSSPNMYLSSASTSPFEGSDMEAEYPAFEGIPVESFTLWNDQMISFEMLTPETEGLVDVIIVNKAGYGKLTTDTNISGFTWQPRYSSGIGIIDE